MNECKVHADSMPSLPVQRCPSILEMAGSAAFPLMAVFRLGQVMVRHQAEYACGSVLPGRAVVERDRTIFE